MSYGSEISRNGADNSTPNSLKRCKSLDLTRQSDNQKENGFDSVIFNILAETQRNNKKLIKQTHELIEQNNHLQEEFQKATIKANSEIQTNISAEGREIEDKLYKMANIEFYKSSQDENKKSIDNLIEEMRENGVDIHEDDILLTRNNKFEVNQDYLSTHEHEQNEKKKRGREIRERIQDESRIYDRLKHFYGHSIAHVVKNGSEDDLNTLTDLALYNLTQSSKKALSISDDKKLADTWDKINKLYKDRKMYGETTYETTTLRKYDEKNSKLKYYVKNPREFRSEARRYKRIAFDFLSHHSMPSYINRSLKREMTITLEQEEARIQHIEQKYGSLKSGIPEDVINSQAIKLSGSRRKERGKLQQIIANREEVQRKLASIELEKNKEKLSYEQVVKEANNVLANGRKLLRNNQSFSAGERRRNLKVAIETANTALQSFSNIHTHNVAIDTKYGIEKLPVQIQRDLERLEERLQKSIKKYGNTPLRNALNDICSDGGFVVTVTGTAVGWLHAVPLATV